MNKEIPEYFIRAVNERIAIIQQTTGIEVIFWSLRGSLDVGIYRDNSDADIIFLYRSDNKNIRAIHDIVGHGMDFWGWIIEDALKTVKMCANNTMDYLKKNECAISNEHRRGSLSYYFGLFVGMGNPFCCITPNGQEYTDSLWKKMYNPNIVLTEFQGRLEKIYKKGLDGRPLSGNEILYGLWYALMQRHINNHGLPGDNKILDVLHKYGDKFTICEFDEIHRKYRMSSGKNETKFDTIHIMHFIKSTYEFTESVLKNADLSLSEMG